MRGLILKLQVKVLTLSRFETFDLQGVVTSISQFCTSGYKESGSCWIYYDGITVRCHHPAALVIMVVALVIHLPIRGYMYYIHAHRNRVEYIAVASVTRPRVVRYSRIRIGRTCLLMRNSNIPLSWNYAQFDQ